MFEDAFEKLKSYLPEIPAPSPAKKVVAAATQNIPESVLDYIASPPNDVAAIAAANLITLLRKEVHYICPAGDGGLVLCWKSNQQLLEVECANNGEINFLLRDLK